MKLCLHLSTALSSRSRLRRFAVFFCATGCLASACAEAVQTYDSRGLKRDFWDNIYGNEVADLTGDSRFPHSPVSSDLYAADFRIPATPDGNLNIAESFGQKLSGYLIAPRTGNYVLWVGGNNSTELWLSPDVNPANKKLVAYTADYNNMEATTKLPVWLSRGTDSGKSSNNNFIFSGTVPGVIRLTGGQPYYIELLHKEGAGSEFAAVGWTTPTDAVLPAEPTEVIPIQYLSPNLPAVSPLSLSRRQQASRFLAQATFGPTPAELSALTVNLTASPATALEAWIDNELTKPGWENVSALKNFRDLCDAQPDYGSPPSQPSEWNPATDGVWSGTLYVQKPRRPYATSSGPVRAALMVEDTHQLRRKLAYAYSQIFVVSDQGDLIGSPEGMCDWMDMLYDNAFGSFEDLLMGVVRHPVMGYYLSHVNNKKSNPVKNTDPDENFAREIMQLFTIGLHELDPNGNYTAGQLTSTYDNDDIMNLARVFTGQIYKRGVGESAVRYSLAFNPTFPKESYYLRKEVNLRGPAPGDSGPATMGINESNHETGSKSYLGHSIPSGYNVDQDLEAAVSRLANHPNTGPFLARALIQRFVTSNPSPHYIQHVANEYVTSNHNMGAVIKKILLLSEARSMNLPISDEHGKLREPWMRIIQLARAFPAAPVTNPASVRYPLFRSYLYPILGQYPLSSPSVFNFYLPSHEPMGDVANRNLSRPPGDVRLVAPEFEILNDSTAIRMSNYLFDTMSRINTTPSASTSRPLALTVTPAQLDLAANPSALVAEINDLLTHGMMTPQSRDIITNAVNSMPAATSNATKLDRVKMAIYLTSISPDFAVLK